MKKFKIGRNDPCPCGSGKKFKKCCGIGSAPLWRQPNPRGVTTQKESWPKSSIPPKVMRRFVDHERRDHERVRRFGHVRPEIAVDFQGYKFVAVGNKLYYKRSDRCRFFTDFLMDYVPWVFGREWFEKEVARPPEVRHPVMQWRVKGMRFMNSQPKRPDGTYEAFPSGFMAAYLTFAYDLYVVDHNARLDARMLERLMHSDQFQGARHELFAEATCLRAGFQVQHEDETDLSRRHAEFNATHMATGQKISVEAKSKHRAGVLGQAGARQAANELNLRFGRLLNDAVGKNVPHPLVVFLDTNLPFEVADRLFERPTGNPQVPARHLITLLDSLREEHGGKDPINLVIFSNHPHHYTKDEEIDPRKHIMSVFSQIPLKPIAHPEALLALHQGANLYGNIPDEFPKE